MHKILYKVRFIVVLKNKHQFFFIELTLFIISRDITRIPKFDYNFTSDDIQIEIIIISDKVMFSYLI